MTEMSRIAERQAVSGNAEGATAAFASFVHGLRFEDIPADVVEITVTHEEGLIHDNSDWRDRVIDCLTRAQMQQDAKAMLLKCVEDAVKLPPERLRPLHGRPDLYPNLGAYLYEIMRQLH